MRLTKQRKGIIESIKESDIPITIESIEKKSPLKMNLSTIYRNLNLLCKKGIIEKIYFKTKPYYIYSDSIHKHYCFCQSCENILEVKCNINEISEKLSKQEFKVLEHDITVYGICKKCQDKINKSICLH